MTPSCLDLGTHLALHQLRPTDVTFMTNLTRRSIHISEIWESNTHFWCGHGILHLWGPQDFHDPTLYLLMGIRLLDIPTE